MTLLTRLLRNAAARRHLLALAILIVGFLWSQAAAGQTPQAVPVVVAPPPESLLDRWLAPDVILGGVLFLLYAGELRGDIRKMKDELADLETRFMSRETTEAKFSELRARIEGRGHH